MPSYTTSYLGKLPAEEALLEISKGNVGGSSLVLKFGMNEDVDITSVPEEVWSYGGVYTFPSDVAVVRVASTDANDTSAGTGARTITIQGLDSNYDEVEVDVTMNGTANVDTTQTFTRVNRAFVKTAGTSEYNVGGIRITHQGSGTPVVAEIPATMGQTQQAVYTVPNNHSAYLIEMSGSVVKRNAGVATLEIWRRHVANKVRRLQSSLNISVDGNTTYQKSLHYSKIDEKTDLYLRCSYASVNNLAIFGNFAMILVKN